jgi:hypothetical protein
MQIQVARIDALEEDLARFYTYVPPEQIEVIGRLAELLDEIEAELEEQLDIEEQMQRLRRLPPEELPPEFRKMADRYFEALAGTGNQ